MEKVQQKEPERMESHLHACCFVLLFSPVDVTPLSPSAIEAEKGWSASVSRITVRYIEGTIRSMSPRTISLHHSSEQRRPWVANALGDRSTVHERHGHINVDSNQATSFHHPPKGERERKQRVPHRMRRSNAETTFAGQRVGKSG